jgi:transposase
METAKAVSCVCNIMPWESNMTTDQKEQYVIQLYTEGKTFKAIAQLTHTSFRDISAINKRHQENIERENGQLEERDDYNDIRSKSKTTQAIKMFSEDRSPTDVVIELDLSPEEVRMIYRQYVETKNMYDFLQVYGQIKHSRYITVSFL